MRAKILSGLGSGGKKAFPKDLARVLHGRLYPRRALKVGLLRASPKDCCKDGVGQGEFYVQTLN